MQGGERDQGLQFLDQVRRDQRWGREVLASMHQPMANALDVLAMLVQFWCQPVIQDGTDGLLWSPFAVALPYRGPCGIHNSRFKTGTTQIDDKDVLRHQRMSQLISTLRGSTFQMLLQYSAMERSDEKKPVRAVLSTDIRFQCMRSVQARLTASWAWT